MQLFANNVETTLASQLTAGATSMSVTLATGMPDPSGNEYFLVTVCARAQNVESEFEVVKCTARTGTTLTIERAQEGTSDVTHANGGIVSLRLTTGTLEDGFPPDLAIGRINNPLLHLPLKNSTDMVCGTGSVTFTRSTTATYVDRYGVVQDAAIDEARFEKEGLLIEGASTNKCLQSEDLSSASWVKSKCTFSADVIDAPDGTTTADGLVGNTDDDVHFAVQTVSTTATTFSASVFVKKGNVDWVRLAIVLRNSTPSTLGLARVYVNLSDGSVGVTTVQNGSMLYTITSCTDGWYRITLSFEYSGAGSANDILFYLTACDADDDITFAGDGSTVNTYIWGAQLEEMPFATSYIPTTTAAVTRTADKCEVTYAGNVPAKNTEEFSIICDADLLGHVNGTTQELWKVIGESSRLGIASSDSNNRLKFYNGTISEYLTTLIVDTSYRIGCIFDKTTQYLYVDGDMKDSDTHVASVTGTATSFQISVDSYPLYGHISNFRIYSEALSEAEMRIA